VAIRLRDALVTVFEKYVADGAVVMDLGCGDMPYRGLLEGRVGRYEGIDLPGNVAARWHILAVGGCNAPAGEADVVVSTQVLEHVTDPVAYLKECVRLLKPGGRVILSTHGLWVYHPDPQDLWRWTGEGLKRLVTEAGLEVESCRGVMGLSAAGVQLLQDGLVRKISKRWRKRLAWMITVPLQRLALVLDWMHSDDERAADAAVFVVVARKTTNGVEQ
jgi:SAM-dependent methyltransferase